jgi:hypothetical protein
MCMLAHQFLLLAGKAPDRLKKSDRCQVQSEPWGFTKHLHCVSDCSFLALSVHSCTVYRQSTGLSIATPNVAVYLTCCNAAGVLSRGLTKTVVYHRCSHQAQWCSSRYFLTKEDGVPSVCKKNSVRDNRIDLAFSLETMSFYLLSSDLYDVLLSSRSLDLRWTLLSCRHAQPHLGLL